MSRDEWAADVKANEVYRFLVTLFIYNDSLVWSRTQLMVAIEGGVLAGAVAKGGPLATIILLVGTILIFSIWELIKRAYELRDQHLDLLDLVHSPIGMRITKPSAAVFRANHVLRFVVWAVIIANLTMALVFFSGPGYFQTEPLPKTRQC